MATGKIRFSVHLKKLSQNCIEFFVIFQKMIYIPPYRTRSIKTVQQTMLLHNNIILLHDLIALKMALLVVFHTENKKKKFLIFFCAF